MTDFVAYLGMIAGLLASLVSPPQEDQLVTAGVHCTASAYNRCSSLIAVAVTTGSPNDLNHAKAYCKASGCLEN